MSGVCLASEFLMYILHGHVPPECLIRITGKCVPEARHGWSPQICGYGQDVTILLILNVKKNWQQVMSGVYLATVFVPEGSTTWTYPEW